MPAAPLARVPARRRADAGFTLIEMLIVIVVLGVLSGIVLFGVSRFRSDANAAACQADVSAVNAAADAYQAVTGNYPRALADLTVGQYLMSAPGGTWTFDETARSVTRAPVCTGPTSTGAASVQPSAAGTTAGTTPAATTPAGTTPAGTTPAAGTTCAGAVSIDNSWPQGYQAAITVTNRGATTLTNWVASWTVPDGVTLNNGWNATVTQSGSRMQAQAPDWSTTLAPGASWAIGFIANGPFSPPPSAVSLNGISCG
jgi:prepilin-type N-terminal cleavage/methylation domain-containing protein